jgi:hypothetical protein
MLLGFKSGSPNKHPTIGKRLLKSVSENALRERPPAKATPEVLPELLLLPEWYRTELPSLILCIHKNCATPFVNTRTLIYFKTSFTQYLQHSGYSRHLTPETNSSSSYKRRSYQTLNLYFQQRLLTAVFSHLNSYSCFSKTAAQTNRI